MKLFFTGNRELQLPIIQGNTDVSLSGLVSAVTNKGETGIVAYTVLLYKQNIGKYLKKRPSEPIVSSAHAEKIETRAGIPSRLLPRFFITIINYKKTVQQHNQKNHDI